MTHNFEFLFPHPTPRVKSADSKTVSLFRMPGAAVTCYPLSWQIWFSSWALGNVLSFSEVTTVNVMGSGIPIANHINLLGITLDNYLSMDKYRRAGFYHPRARQHFRPIITVEDTNMIACSVIGLTQCWTASHWKHQSSSAHLECSGSKYRRFATATLFKRLAAGTKLASYSLLLYIKNSKVRVPCSYICHQFLPQLISHSLYVVPWLPKVKTVFDSCTFCIVVNSLSQDIRSCDKISTSCRHLKTFYFSLIIFYSHKILTYRAIKQTIQKKHEKDS